MGAIDRNGNKLTLNVLEKWVREFLQQNGIRVGDEKYPLFYGTYMAKEDEKNDRFANYYQSYWKDTTPELRSAEKTLTKQSKELRKQIYIRTGIVLVYFQENLEPDDFSYAKDELLSWIAGMARMAEVQRDRAAYGFGVVKKIDEVDYLKELADDYAINLLKKVDVFRYQWLEKYEKLIVTKDCINAKDNKVALKFVPNRLHEVTSKDGKEYLELRQEWGSEEGKTRAGTETDSSNDQEKATIELTEKCLVKIKKIAKENTYKPSRWVIEKAYKSRCCQYEIVNGDKKKIGSWSTLRNRLKDYYPDLYKSTFKK